MPWSVRIRYKPWLDFSLPYCFFSRGLRGCCSCRHVRERIGQELADNLRHLGRRYEIVMAVARHDRQPRLRQLRVQPARLLHAAAQKREELRNVLLRERVI